MKNPKILTLGVIILMLSYACEQKVIPDYLYTIKNKTVDAVQLKTEPVIWSSEIVLNVTLLKAKREKPLRLILEEKKEIDISLSYLDLKGKNAKWHGTISKDPGSSVLFVITENNIVAGNIRLASGELYKIRYYDKGRYLVVKIDVKKYPEDAPAIVPKEEEVPVEMEPCPNTDPASKIDIMVLYTDDTRSAAGGTDAIESELLLAVEETNMAYINSNINQRINLVYLGEVSYAETGSANSDISNLQDTSDGILDNIHTLRDNHSADLVSLIVETLDYGGVAYVMETVNTGFEDYAFSVVKRSNATGVYSFAHELGHNMGAQHDCDNNVDTDPYVYAHGYYETSPTPTGVANWRTVMSYEPAAGAARICYFSNPGIVFPPGATDGDVMGTTTGTCQADNHKALNNTAVTVANFRCTGSGVENVWMKDTWNDTGQEPDPNTITESMWKSPYIWVRNNQDTDLVYQHQHENPIYGTGISNWVYVKLHNGGNAITGTLEIYYANASISLTWPTSWTKIDDLAMTIDASTTEIAEFEWTGLPGTGHYCLLARWNSTSDPMATAEGSNIGYNVRQNNNLVWKNVNIVPTTGSDEPISTDVSFFGIDKQKSVIRITCLDEYPFKAFSEYALLTLEFDDITKRKLANWESQSKYLNKEGEKYVIKGAKAELRNLPLDSDHKGIITLTFKANKNTPKMIYYVDIKQLDIEDNKETEIGGVSYEIDTQLK